MAKGTTGGKHTSYIVVLDDSHEDAENVSRSLLQCFLREDIHIKIETITRASELPALLSTHPDVVVCDVSLAGGDDIKGLELIQNFKRRHPHIAFAAMTANLDQLAKIDQIEVTPDFILPKNLLLPVVDEQFAKRLISLILQSTRQNRHLTISMSSEIEAALKRTFNWQQKFERETVDCLIRQVFSTNVLPASAAVDFEVSPEQVNLAPSIIEHVEIREFETGRSGSSVFLAIPTVSGQEHDVSVVLKFCDGDSFVQELRNYVRYVKWTLPYSWRVDVLGVGYASRKYGVIGYSLAFAGSSDAQTLLKSLEAGDASAVETVIGQIFDDDRKVWYKNPQSAGSQDLRTVLTNRYFGNGQKFNAAKRNALDVIGASDAFHSWGGDRRSLARALDDTLTRGKLALFQQCICHGDLHAGNVMLSPDGLGMVFIDFQDTGRHHVFTDFVFFENAIRKDGCFDWGNSAEHLMHERSAIRDALGVKAPESPVKEGDRLIRLVRNQAIANFKDEPMENYFLHALVFSILMLSGRELESRARERLAAFVIACVEVLANDTQIGS